MRSTIGLAHSLGLTVVAEGVESREAWERLIGYECDEAQGYYFSAPLTPEEFSTTVAVGADSAAEPTVPRTSP